MCYYFLKSLKYLRSISALQRLDVVGAASCDDAH
jgi:hypothetical protein